MEATWTVHFTDSLLIDVTASIGRKYFHSKYNTMKDKTQEVELCTALPFVHHSEVRVWQTLECSHTSQALPDTRKTDSNTFKRSQALIINKSISPAELA